MFIKNVFKTSSEGGCLYFCQGTPSALQFKTRYQPSPSGLNVKNYIDLAACLNVNECSEFARCICVLLRAERRAKKKKSLVQVRQI